MKYPVVTLSLEPKAAKFGYAWWGHKGEPVDDPRLFCREEFDRLCGTQTSCRLELTYSRRMFKDATIRLKVRGVDNEWPSCRNYICDIVVGGKASYEVDVLQDSLDVLVAALDDRGVRKGTVLHCRLEVVA